MYHIVSHRPQKIMHTYTVYHITKIAKAAKNDYVKYVHKNTFSTKSHVRKHVYKYRTMPLGPKNGKLIYFITSLKHPRLHFTHRISRLKQEKWQSRSLIGKILDHFEGIGSCILVFQSIH